MRRICVVDTDFLLVYLDVPGFNQAGPDIAPIDHEAAKKTFLEEKQKGSKFVLTYAVMIEAGNHISQAKSKRADYAKLLTKNIEETLDDKQPWVPYDETRGSQTVDYLRDIVGQWPYEAERHVGLGDYSIRQVVDTYQRSQSFVRILTGDQLLLGYQSHESTLPPSRRPDRSRN